MLLYTAALKPSTTIGTLSEEIRSFATRKSPQLTDIYALTHLVLLEYRLEMNVPGLSFSGANLHYYWPKTREKI